jgi:hypothetical protein
MVKQIADHQRSQQKDQARRADEQENRQTGKIFRHKSTPPNFVRQTGKTPRCQA